VERSRSIESGVVVARSLRLLSLLFLALACACAARDRGSPRAVLDGSETCSAVDDPRCANPIDALVLPAFARLHLEPRPAERHELCRRLAVDLFGRAPTEAERDRCVSSSTEAIVDAWLDSKEHALAERRHWATVIDYDATYVWPKLVEDLDRLAGRLARDELSYPEFATHVALHPVFYARHPDTDWFHAIYDVFLGRTARPDEVLELMPLLPIWRMRELPDDGTPPAFYVEYGFSPCACPKGACRSEALGRVVDFGTTCRKQDEHVRLIGVSAGQRGQDHTSVGPNRWGNNPTAVDENNRPLPVASAEQAKRLRSLGSALTSRLDFYEAAVDRELRRMLGWWQTSFNQPDTDLPRVRAALAAQLRATGSIRELQRAILTSVLYTTSSMGNGDERAPVWSSGPRKLMPAEAWLDSAAAAVGRPLVRCDHRYVASSQFAMYEDFVAPPTERRGPDFDYLQASRSLGGSCRLTRVDRPNIGGLEAQRALAVRLCAEGDQVLPPEFEGYSEADFEAASGHLVERILGRPSTPQERDVLAGDMRACMQRPERGCAIPEQAVRWTCVRLLTSAEYATY
jgi:hypothetical protein